MSLKTSKTWTWSTLIRDHTKIVSSLPGYLGSYISPSRSLPPVTIEAVMVTMNSYNTCPYCTGLHGQLARMAGMAEPDPNDPAVVYAKTFALESGRGPDVDAAFDKLVAKMGQAKAESVRCLCWALLWGKTTGNTVNSARDNILKFKWKSVTSSDLFVLAYYGPLFLVIGVLNAGLKFAPGIPKAVSAGVGAVLWLPQALNIVPLGVVSLAFKGGVV